MSSVSIKLSQQVMDFNSADAESSSLSDVFDTVISAASSLAARYTSFDTWKLQGNKLTMKFSDGANAVWTGQVSQSTTYSGSAYVTSQVLTVPGTGAMTVKGGLHYNYDTYGSALYITPVGGTITSYRLDAKGAADAKLGDTYIELNGSLLWTINNSSSSTLDGTINKITLGATKFVKSLVVDGQFHATALTGTESTAQGVMSGFTETYRDGSSIKLSGSFNLAADTKLDASLLSNAEHWTGDDTFSISLPAVMTEDWYVRSGAGADKLDVSGGGGHVFVEAGEGDDIVTVRDAAVHLDGGAGDDRIETALSTFSMAGTEGFEQLVYTGKLAAVLTGDDGANRITGGIKGDSITGGAGDDTIDGGKSVDAAIYSGVRASYTINVVSSTTVTVTDDVADRDGSDTLQNIEKLVFADGFVMLGGSGADKLKDGEGDDMLYGNAGNDNLTAGAGNDILIGGAGKDVLTGGLGADTFVFADLATGGVDTVKDFSQAQGDHIQLDLSIFTALAASGEGPASLAGHLVVGAKAVAVDADDVLLFDTASRTLSYDADGAGGAAAVKLVVLTGVSTLSEADFILA